MSTNISSVLEAEKKRVQLAILTTASHARSLSGRSTAELVIVINVSRILLLALLASLLATLLTALLRVSSWCLLALFLTVVLTFTSLTHVSEIVVLHSVICHGCLLLPLFG